MTDGELHVMRPAQLLGDEIDRESLGQFLAVPYELLQEVGVFRIALVPVGEQ